MEQDLKIIKKKYGEKMMHLCRELFSTILDNSPGVLSQILQETFAPSHFLYDDLIKRSLETKLKNYIYYLYDKLQVISEPEPQPVEDPVTLMKRAGYTLYECQTEADVQKFKKYYSKGEELCTFRDNRLNYCYVYFAVKDGAEKLKRQDFINPHRQDEYGTSVISIQFTRDSSHILSIKNRYNHTVSNPDATFSNDLDNIIPGLTQSFADYYGMSQQHSYHKFEIPGYVRASDGKFYKYNYERDNIYYCSGNIVIDNFQVHVYPPEKYLVMDYFILDLVNKKFINYTKDSFPETIPTIKTISIKNENEEKTVTITPYVGEDIIIILNKYNQIVSLKNNNVIKIGDDFLKYNKYLQTIILDHVKEIGNRFMTTNTALTKVSLTNVEKIGDYFIENNSSLSEISLPNVKEIGHLFMYGGHVSKVSLPKVTVIGDNFIAIHNTIKTLDMPELTTVGDNFLVYSDYLVSISLPKLTTIGSDFLQVCYSLESITLPEVLSIGDRVMIHSNIKVINLPKVEEIGHHFMAQNNVLHEINFPNVVSIGNGFMTSNKSVTMINMPKVKTIGSYFMPFNNNIVKFYAPKLSSKLSSPVLADLAMQSATTNKKVKCRLLQMFRKK